MKGASASKRQKISETESKTVAKAIPQEDEEEEKKEVDDDGDFKVE